MSEGRSTWLRALSLACRFLSLVRQVVKSRADMYEEPFDPATLCEDAFLAGPGRYDSWDGKGNLLDIDDIFGKDFWDLYREQEEFDSASVSICDSAIRTPSLMAAGYEFVEIEAGILLLSPEGKICGGYIGCDLAVDCMHQGQGLGAELVLEFAMRNGWLPTWGLDEAAYTSAGEAAHRKAHALAHDRDFFAAKREQLAKASVPKDQEPGFSTP